MAEPTVTIEKEVPLTEAFAEETPVNCAHGNITVRGTQHVSVALASERQFWKTEEFDLENSPWRVHNVNSGEYGPEVVFVREE